MNNVSYNERMDANSGTNAGAQSVVRAINLLKSFTDSHPVWSLTDLAEANDLNRTTAYRLLTTLENEGLVARSADNRLYRLGPELIALGGCAMRSHDLRMVSRPYVQSLAEATGEAATLEILSGSQVIVLDETSGNFLVGMSQDVGHRLPAHATSTGKVMLAYADAATIDSYLSTPLEKRTERTIASAQMLREHLQLIRQQGYSVAVDELEIGFVAIAGPVHDNSGAVIASVSIGGPSMRLTEDKVDAFVPLVVETADTISAQLGYRTR